MELKCKSYKTNHKTEKNKRKNKKKGERQPNRATPGAQQGNGPARPAHPRCPSLSLSGFLSFSFSFSSELTGGTALPDPPSTPQPFLLTGNGRH
jgi:hypothetical protein